MYRFYAWCACSLAKGYEPRPFCFSKRKKQSKKQRAFQNKFKLIELYCACVCVCVAELCIAYEQRWHTLDNMHTHTRPSIQACALVQAEEIVEVAAASQWLYIYIHTYTHKDTHKHRGRHSCYTTLHTRYVHTQYASHEHVETRTLTHIVFARHQFFGWSGVPASAALHLFSSHWPTIDANTFPGTHTQTHSPVLTNHRHT